MGTVSVLQLEGLRLLASGATMAEMPAVCVENGRVTDTTPAALERGVEAGMTLQQARWYCPAVQVVTENGARVSDKVRQVLSLFRHLGLSAGVLAEQGPNLFAVRGGVGEHRAALAAALVPAHSLRVWVAEGERVPLALARLRAGQQDSALRAAAEALVSVRLAWDQVPLACWPGLSARDVAALKRLGCRTVGDLRRRDRVWLLHALGRSGERLWREMALPGYVPRADLGAQEISVRVPVPEVSSAFALEAAVESLARELAARLRRAGAAAQELSLQVETEEGMHASCRLLSLPTAEAPRLARFLRSLLLSAARAGPVTRLTATGGKLVRWGGEPQGFSDLMRPSWHKVVERYGAHTLRVGVPPPTFRERRLQYFDPWQLA